MNSSWVRQPRASAKLGLIPFFGIIPRTLLSSTSKWMSFTFQTCVSGLEGRIRLLGLWVSCAYTETALRCQTGLQDQAVRGISHAHCSAS